MSSCEAESNSLILNMFVFDILSQILSVLDLNFKVKFFEFYDFAITVKLLDVDAPFVVDLSILTM